MNGRDTAWDWIRRTSGLGLTTYLALSHQAEVSPWVAVLIAGLLFGPDVAAAQFAINRKVREEGGDGDEGPLPRARD